MGERKAYRPSNGTEGMSFYGSWCDRCANDKPEAEDGGCRILYRTLAFQIGEPEYPSEWVYDEKGNPCCTAFKEADNERA